MSLIATNPFAWCTYVPWRTIPQKRQSSRCFGTDALLGDRRGAHPDDPADGRVDEPGRVVVAVAAARPVDEHRVLGAELAVPAANAQLVRERAQARAALLLDGGGDGV